MTEIKHYVQGKAEEAFFAHVGHWLTSRAVLTELGGPVTSEVGDIWLVCLSEGVPQGFALIHPRPDSAHVKHVYSESPKVRSLLLKELLKMMSGGLRVFTVQRGDDTLWAEHGFAFTKRARGEYGTWEREAKA
jgi:hypothetical protein